MISLFGGQLTDGVICFILSRLEPEKSLECWPPAQVFRPTVRWGEGETRTKSQVMSCAVSGGRVE